MITKFLHVRYRVSDLEKTVIFYRDILGLEEIRRTRSERGSQLVFFKSPGSNVLIEICQFDGSGAVNVGHDITHLAFEVEDMEVFKKHISLFSYTFSDGPSVTDSGSIIAFIDAPEGYEIEIIQKLKLS